MKNLVMKIALPGAILAFAMALFGGTAYAFSKWESTMGPDHLKTIKGSIDDLAKRIERLKAQKGKVEDTLKAAEADNQKLRSTKEELENELKAKSQAPDANSQITQLQNNVAELGRTITDRERTIEEKKREIIQLNADIENYKDKIESHAQEIEDKKKEAQQTQQDADKLTHEGIMGDALREMKNVRQHAETTANREDLQVPEQ